MMPFQERPLVKICGIREPEHARVAVEAGADLVGLNFYHKSHRNILIRQAREVADEVRRRDVFGQVRIVGLFVNEPVNYMCSLADMIGLDIIQLSGDEDPSIMWYLNRPAIGTVRASNYAEYAARGRFDSWIEAEIEPWAIILDTHVPGLYCGSGVLGDWELAAEFATKHPVLLAGGLTPENVADGASQVRPFAVDVSSGVETDRRKDSEKIRAFISATRSMDAVVRQGG